MTEQKILNLINSSGSFSRNAIVATSYENNYIFSGNSFNVETVVTIGSGDTTYDLAFDTSGMDRSLVALPITWATTAGPVIATLGTCTSYTGGTELTPLNRDYSYQVSFPAQSEIHYDVVPTGYSATTTKVLIGTSATNQSTGGGTTRGSLPRVLQTGPIYVYRIANNAGEEISFHVNFNWYEF